MGKKGRVNDRDDRDPRVALSVPPFGPPARAAQCEACGLWFPWAAFYRPRKREPRTVVGTGTRAVGSRVVVHRQNPYKRCIACREANVRSARDTTDQDPAGNQSTAPAPAAPAGKQIVSRGRTRRPGPPAR